MKLGLIGLAVVAGIASSADASASPLFDLTGGTDGLGGLQAGTIQGGASASYFNPALLTDLPFGLTLGVMTVSSQIGISLDVQVGEQTAVQTDYRAGKYDIGYLASVAVTPNESCNCITNSTIGTAISCTSTCSDGSTPGTFISVATQVSYIPLLSYPGVPNPMTLNGYAVVRVQ